MYTRILAKDAWLFETCNVTWNSWLLQNSNDQVCKSYGSCVLGSPWIFLCYYSFALNKQWPEMQPIVCFFMCRQNDLNADKSWESSRVKLWQVLHFCWSSKDATISNKGFSECRQTSPLIHAKAAQAIKLNTIQNTTYKQGELGIVISKNWIKRSY